MSYAATRKRSAQPGARPVSLGEAAKVWNGLIAICQTSPRLWPERRLQDFRHELVRASRTAFPVAGASAANAARGFLEFGLAYAYAAPERQDLIAPVLVAAARCLDELLNGERRELARRAHLAQSPDDRE